MDFLNSDLIKLNLKCEDAHEVIETLGTLMLKKELVKDTYIKAVAEREKVYPTGLPTEGVCVAIPHTDSSHVNKSAIAVGILDKPVEFHMMGGTGEKLQIEVVLMLAIKDPIMQLELLKKLMNIFQNAELLKNIKKASSINEVYNLLKILQN